MFTALLDTSVLWPGRQRDFLLSLAAEGLYRPIWSAAILDELERTEAHKLRGLGKSNDDAMTQAAGLIAQMRLAFDDAEVSGWEPLVGTFGLRDADDEHVVAAAVTGQAGAIVTLDRDFEPDKLPPGLDVISPAKFAHNTVSLHPRLALRAVDQMALRSGRKGRTLSVYEIFHILETRYGMNDAVELLRPWM
jgi:predicted nucleic acid-binding protein